MNKLVLSFLSIVLCGYAHMAQAAEEFSVSMIQAIEDLQKRADQLVIGEVGSNDYYLAKARTWIDLALGEYHERDPSGIVEAAIEQAKNLIEALERKETSISKETQRDVPGAEIVRQELWDKIAEIKSKAHDCLPSKLAEAEVYLVWAGHEKKDAAWGHGEPYVQTAKNLIYEAQVDWASCQAALASSGKNVAVAPMFEKVELFSSIETFGFGSDVFDKSAEAKLDRLIETAKGWKQLYAIELTGHADHLSLDGDQQKNQKLSEWRAEAVKRYLVSKGIAAEKIHVVGVGSSEPLVWCSGQMPKSVLIDCLRPNRRVEIVLRGEK